MSRLIVHVEGQTEETFVNEVLGPHLYNHGYSAVSARLLGNVRQRQARGGIRGWQSVRKEIVNHFKQDPECLATTMVDYYGLPSNWPGRAASTTLAQPSAKAAMVEDAILQDINREMDVDFDPDRFVPYVMMHEFEAMLFSDCDQFARVIGRSHLFPRFQEIRDGFESPEAIDDSPVTAPSKRIAALVPRYPKPLMGALAVESIGLAAIRGACPHFRDWLERLERLAASP